MRGIVYTGDGVEVTDDTVVATAMELEHATIRLAHVRLANASESAEAGAKLARELAGEGLSHLFVLAEGLNINGTELVRGLRDSLPARVAVTGGLAGDAAKFEQTLVCVDGEVLSGAVVGLAFYGDRLRVGYGSMGGWDSFGPDRTITRASGNVLYELDGSPALDLYKTYLGPHAADLPSSGPALEIAGALEGGAARDAQARLHLGGDDAGEARLAETRRAREQDVVGGLPALPRRGEHDLEVLLEPGLADELVEPARPEAAISLRVATSSSSPSKRSASQPGTDAPQRAAKLLVCLKFCTGRMPGTTGTSMPRPRTRSR